MIKHRINAYSLAEVLITLGIVGVIAVMTLPNLVSETRKIVLKTQFKKEYSSVQNALNIISAEGLVDCYLYFNIGKTYYQTVTKQCRDVETRLSQILNASVVENNFKKNYSSVSKLKTAGATFVNDSFNYDNYLYRSKSYQLQDGSVILICSGEPYIILDVNGLNGPNKYGYDVFYMHFYLNDKIGRIIMVNYLAGIKEQGGYFPDEIIKSIEKLPYSHYRQNL